MLSSVTSNEKCCNCGEAKAACASKKKLMGMCKFGPNFANISKYHECYKEICALEADKYIPKESLLEEDNKDISDEEEKFVANINEMFYDEDYGEYSESEPDSNSESSSDSNSESNSDINSDNKSDSDSNSDSDHTPQNIPDGAPNSPPNTSPHAAPNPIPQPPKPKKKHKYQLSIKKKAFVKKSVMVVPDKIFTQKFTETYYFKKFRKTPRYPPLEEALNDLKNIFKYNRSVVKQIQRSYNKYNTI
ncbi:unnamed protein product [Moneuplotes crassus]|uniref:Uncharacterized protein n=1 Tax=Euplotes crassus TaxID=5936 RepID=A0AAD1TYR3_EUPCR|nr:unnamed protein product [Moneuplotes crassus]